MDLISKFFKALNQLGLQLLSEKYSSVAKDTRTELEKGKDYIYGEDVVLPRGGQGARITKLPFTAYNQQKTSACGAFAAGHMRRLYEKTVTYPIDWYRTRTNFAGEGMFLRDVLRLGALANETQKPKKSPSTLTEEYANSRPLLNVFDNNRNQKFEYTTILPYDVDAVLDAVSNGIPTLVSFYSTIAEWKEEMTPWDVVSLYTAPVRHYVVVLPNSFHTKDGQDWVSVIDSSPSKGFSLRHLSVEFLKKRMYLGGGFYYPVSTKKRKVDLLPINPVSYGESSGRVLDLQRFLYQEGYMSDKHLTGYYGNITSGAVLAWQLKNIVDGNKFELDNLQGRWWGRQSISAAVNKYRINE